jgi:hypothetical protein
MSEQSDFSGVDPADIQDAILRARSELRDVQGALSRVTGGASLRIVLAELAQELASDLAGFFDDLPMERFSGRIDWGERLGRWRWTVAPRVWHRIILARFLSATYPERAGVGYTATHARIAVLAMGEDGVLRTGVAKEQIHLPENAELTYDLVGWDDGRIRGVPSRSVRLNRWTGESDPHEVASPGRVLEALTAIAARVTRESNRDLALIQRFL